MHILFLTDNFPPEVNAPASRTFDHCREWTKAGHQVTVITGVPNFPKGKIFEGYRNRIWQQETMEGIRVIRVWTYIVANEGFAKRTLDYLSFMMTCFLASLFVRRVDIIVGTSPQFFTVCAAYMVSLCKRVPWVFEVRDLWPESIRVVGAMKQGKLLTILEKIELFLYKKATVIVVVTHSFKKSLKLRGIPEDKIHIITNGVDITQFSPRLRDISLVEQYGLQGKFVVGYIGTHGLAHGLDTLLDAAKLVKEQSDLINCRFLMIGEGANKEALCERVLSEGIDNIIFLDSVKKNEVNRYWSLLDVAIIHLKNHDLFKSVIPSKLFECMSMAIPVLHGVQGESAEIVKSEKVGLLFEPENPVALVEGLRRLSREPNLISQFKLAGPSSAQKYTRTTLAKQMLEIFVEQVECD